VLDCGTKLRFLRKSETRFSPQLQRLCHDIHSPEPPAPSHSAPIGFSCVIYLFETLSHTMSYSIMHFWCFFRASLKFFLRVLSSSWVQNGNLAKVRTGIYDTLVLFSSRAGPLSEFSDCIRVEPPRTGRMKVMHSMQRKSTIRL
jgi:hypothetical protein